MVRAVKSRKGKSTVKKKATLKPATGVRKSTREKKKPELLVEEQSAAVKHEPAKKKKPAATHAKKNAKLTAGRNKAVPASKTKGVKRKAPVKGVKKAKKAKVEKKAKAPAGKRYKNDKLKPRDGFPDLDENPFLYANKLPTEKFVSVAAYSRLAVRHTVRKDLAALRKLVNDKRRFPKWGLSRGYSYGRRTPPALLAAVTEDKKFYKEFLEVSKKLDDDYSSRATVETSMLEKMTSGRMNVHMLGHATAAIEATRGAREGNNAFIRYDNNARLETGEGQFLVESGISFEMLEEITSLPGSGLTKHHFSDKIVYAVRMGHRKLAANLIEHFYDYGFNKLHKETLRNDAESLEKFAPISVTKKANENKKITPVHTAAINPNAAYLKELSVHAADPNEPDSENWYTIHYAAVCEGDGPLRLLLERETPIVLLNKIKESPLHCAARAGRVKNVELLVQALRKMPAPIVEDNAHDIDAEPAPKKAKPVVDPATNHMNAKDKHGHTPLHLAVKYGRYDVVDFLLKQPEINVEATTIASDNKLTPLIMACQNGDRRMADLLIEKGHAFVEQPDKLKRTPLTYATMCGESHIVAMLLQRGAHVSTKPDTSGNNAAHYAAAYGWLDCLELLAKADPDSLSAPNSWHLTPLSVAYLKGHTGIVEYLLDSPYADKVNVNAVDNNGRTLVMLLIAAQQGSISSRDLLEQLRYLKSKGADASVLDSTSSSALHFFAQFQAKLQHPSASVAEARSAVDSKDEYHTRMSVDEYKECVDLLLEAGADLHAANGDGKTPLDIALEAGNLLLATYLLDKDVKTAVTRWIQAEPSDHKTTVLHLLARLPFKCYTGDWWDDYGPVELQYDVEPLFTRITNACGAEFAQEWAQQRDENGHIPLSLLSENIIGLSPRRGGQHDKELAASAEKFLREMCHLAETYVALKPDSLLTQQEEIGSEEKAKKRKRPLLSSFETALNWPHRSLLEPFEVARLKQKTTNLLLVAFLDVASKHRLTEKALALRDSHGRTPLIYAVVTGRTDAALLLIAEAEGKGLGDVVNGAVVTAMDDDGKDHQDVGKTVLQLAIEHERFDVINELARNKNVLAKPGREGTNVMHHLAVMKSGQAVKYFKLCKDKGATFVRSKDGRYPIHYAVRNENLRDSADVLTEPIEWLINNDSVGLNARDDSGRTALHYMFVPPVSADEYKETVPSTASDPIAIVSLLVKDMDPSAVLSADKWGNNALHYAAQRGANICTVTLLRHGLPVNKANNAGNTPLALATMNGHESVTLTLIQAQSDISLKAYGPTPPTTDERLVRWTWIPRRPKPERRFEAAISALVVRNGWQGIIYVILDVLKKSRETLIRLVAAALDHEKYNLAQTLLRMLKDVPVSSGGAVNGTPNGPVLTGEDAVDVFYIFATHTSVSDARAPVLRMLFEAGLEWTQPDGTSRCVEELGRHGTISELMAIRTLDGELRSFKSWNRMLQTNSVKVLLRNLVEYWCSAGRRSTGAYDDVLSVYVRQFPEYMNVSKELLEFEKPAFEGMESAQPKSPVAETERVTVLIRAIQRRCLDLMKFLVEEMKVDVNAADEKGRTPLMHAVAANNVAAVHLLMGIPLPEDDDKQKAVEPPKPRIRHVACARRTMFLGGQARRAQSSDGSGDEDGSYQDSGRDGDSEHQSDDEQQSDAGSDAVPGDDSDADEPTTSKKARKEDKKTATAAATSLPQNIQLRKELDLHKLDKQGRNFVHYMVDPNAWENVDLLRTIIAAASGAKQLLTKPDKYGRTPADIAVDTYQKRMCTEIQKMTVTFRPKPKPRSEAPLPQTQHKVGEDSTAFLRQQEELGKGKAVPKDERKPHRNSGYATSGEIVLKNDKLYKILLHKTELLAFGYNGFHNYYRMELIQRRGSELFILFTNWGRIGDPTGQYQRTPFGSFEEADKEFKSVFRQKTGNNWDDAFEEKENKYRIVSVQDGSSDEISELEIELKPKEYLNADRNDVSPDKVVYETIKDISSAKRLQERSRAVSSYKTRLPFGKLKAEDLLKAKELLGDLQKLIADLEKVSNDDKQAQADKTKERLRISRQRAEVSNKFYRVMPLGGFENCALPVIEDQHTLKGFSKIIEQMLEYEVAGQLVTAAAFRQPQIDPYRYIRSALECDLKLLDADGAETQHILQYIQNSSRVRVSAIFSVNSKASTELFNQKHPTLWPTSENHWYLWHGTKPENLLSILKRGLLVAPSSALQTGQAYGEGVYFSDMFTKSEAYCTHSEDGFKYATLCEVDLSGMYCSKEYMPNIDEDAKAKASPCVKVYGRQRPNPAFGKTMPTGVRMALGSTISGPLYENGKRIDTYNDYSEYIVKDVSNTVIRYLVKFQG